MSNIPIITPETLDTHSSMGFGPESKAKRHNTEARPLKRELSPKLEPHHREHLSSEGFTDQEIDTLISKFRVKSLSESQALGLGFKSWGVKKWQSSPGIYFPFTGDFGQLRADRPIPRKDGKPAKYLTQKSKASEAFIPEGCVAITEGFKDAVMATLRGVPTGAMAGVSHYKKALPKDCRYTIVFDSDGRSNPQVFHNLIKAGMWCKGKVLILDAMPDHPKGGLCELYRSGGELDLSKAVKPVDLLLDWPNHWDDLPGSQIAKLAKKAVQLAAEFLPENEVEAFIHRLSDQHPKAGLRKRTLQKIKKQALRKVEGNNLNVYQKAFKTLSEYFVDRFKWNQALNSLELDGEKVSEDSIRNIVLLDNGLDIRGSKDILIDLVKYLAEQNPYNPIQDYLNEVFEKYKDQPKLLQKVRESIAQRYLRTSKPTADVYLMKTLIAAVARAFEPGCKVDTMLILKGAQGIGKSSAVRSLLPDPKYYCGDFWNIYDKDQILKAHQSWITEWGELVGIGKREAEELKMFMSNQTDHIRPPYARASKEMARSFIFFGTTNESQFLSDPTGDRRSWTIDCGDTPIDVEAIERDKDLIWAAAVDAYHNEEIWWLTLEQEKVLKTENQALLKLDAWHERIEEYLSDKNQVSYEEIYNCVLELETSKQDNRAKERIRRVLQILGFENPNKTIRHTYKLGYETITKPMKVWVRKQPLEPYSPSSPVEDSQKTLDLPTDVTNVTNVTNTLEGLVTPKSPSGKGFQESVTNVTSKSPTLRGNSIKKEVEFSDPRDHDQYEFVAGRRELVGVRHGDI